MERTQKTRRLGVCLVLWALLLVSTTASGRAAVIEVTTLLDLDTPEGLCSLREAVVASNTDTAYQDCPAGSGADVVEIALEGTIALVADLEPIEEATTFRGLGAANTVIDGGGTWEIFHFVDGIAGTPELLRVERLQLTGGSANQGGAIHVGANRSLEVVEAALTNNQSILNGGAVFANAAASIAIEQSSVLDNTAAGGSGGGASIEFSTGLTIVDSTFARNTAAAGQGGAVHTLSVEDLVVRSSTFSSNEATGDGGGVVTVVTPALFDSATFVGNTADTDGDDNGDGGGLSLVGAATGTLVNTLIAGNVDSTPAGTICPDASRRLGATAQSLAFNLLGANDCLDATFPVGLPNLNGDFVGTAAAPIDPLLGGLDDNGGPTETHLPTGMSPAIDQGSCPGALADQRGFGHPPTSLRIVDDSTVPDLADGCDIGSVEAGAVSFVFVFADGFESGNTSEWSATVP